jgi:two-component system phosphate regulon sensor histidine kinase PhoR
VSDKAEAILAGIADAVITTSADGKIRSANRAAEGLFGCEAEAARDERCGTLVALRDGARTFACTDRCQLLESHGESTVEVHRTGPNGQRQPLLASATPLIAADGQVVEVIHSFRDITSVKQADEAKTLFLATASHELKTPLTVIRGFAQMLRAATLPPEQHKEATTAIESRATQLSSIVDRLLMTSRIEAGHVDLEPVRCRVDEVLAQRTRELEAATSRPVQRQLPDALPVVWADVDGLTTALDHLLENAVKYSPDGGAVVLAAEVHDGWLRIRCRDEGIGMTDEQQARCFERFWQAEGTDVRRFGGTGIGLYIVRSLIEAMDGRVDVESAPGRGSTFTISLRLDPPTGADGSAAEDAAGGPSIVDEFMRQVGMPIEHPEAG